MYIVKFTDEAWEEYQYWCKTDTKKVHKITSLIKNCCQTPYTGIGKPEPLKHQYM